jgi:hypothetical protein
MVETLQKNADRPLGKGLDALLENVLKWSKTTRLKDDATLLALEIADH